jgi:nicotinate-nucleotide adenylyltransferase
MNSRRIGILGGSFNPPHIGHLIIAQVAYEAFDLSKVIFIPSNQPPHKAPEVLTEPAHRMAMTVAAIGSDPRFEVSDLELKLERPSYTINTARQLFARYPETEICFIIGSDSLLELHLWKDINELLKLCRFVTIVRPGYPERGIKASDIHLPAPWPGKLITDMRIGTMVDVSSSDIRDRVPKGMSIKYLVPAAVEGYIAEHKLYTG